jgi:hypothetical protein
MDYSIGHKKAGPDCDPCGGSLKDIVQRERERETETEREKKGLTF